MGNRLLKVPQVTFRAGVPAVPPTPAYCVDEPLYSDYGAFASAMQRAIQINEAVSGADIGTSYFGVIGTNAQGQKIYGLKTVAFEDLSNLFFGPGSILGSPLVYAYYRRCYPAVSGKPAIPPATTYDAQTGWNSGGMSIGGFPSNGYAEFYVGSEAIGVVVGISTGPDTESPGDCSHAFYINTDSVNVIERGQVVYTVPAAVPGAAVLRITRRSGVVTYEIGDTQVYQSLVASVGYARIDASLYVAGDYVDSPVVGVLQVAQAQVSVGVTAFIDNRPRATAYVGVTSTARGSAGGEYRDTANTRVGVTSTAAGYARNQLAATGNVGVVSTATLAANRVEAQVPSLMVISTDSSYADVSAAYPGGYDVSSIGGYPVLLFAGAFAVTPPTHVFSYGPSGSVGAVDIQAPTGDVISADYAYAQVVAPHGGNYYAQSYEPWLADDALFIGESLFIKDQMTPFVAVHATFSSVVEVGDALTVELELLDGFEWLEALIVTASFAELSDKSAEFADTVYVTDQTMDEKSGVRQVASNTATAAPTTYTDFDFITLHHLGRFGSFAVREDGVYRVASGGLVSAHVDTGSSVFGGYAPKRLEAIYIGMRTDGQLIAVVRAQDESERTYRVIQRPDYMRVNPAKGDSSKSWRLRLELTDAQEGDVDVIQFVVSEQSRRWSR